MDYLLESQNKNPISSGVQCYISANENTRPQKECIIRPMITEKYEIKKKVKISK